MTSIIKMALAAFAGLTYSLAITAQQPAPQQQTRVYEERGAQLLKTASEKLKALKSVKITFTYEMANERQDIEEIMEGVLFSQGNKYNMKVGDNQFISDGTNVWSYMEEIGEVQVNLVENTDGALTPTSILEEFDQQYKSTFIRQESHLGRQVDIVDLVPNQPQTFFKYRLALDARTNMMVYAIAYDRHGGTYTYSIKSLESNISIPPATFSFIPGNFPGIEVIDLR